MKRISVFFTCLLLVCTITNAQLRIVNTFVENRNKPVGLDERYPRFTWVIASDDRQVLQNAYEIRVSDCREDLEKGVNLAWSTGKIRSGQSVHVNYEGETLKPGTKYFWKVKVWDNKGNVSEWSQADWWQTGLMDPLAWEADWITAEQEDDATVNYFRKDFKAGSTGEIKNATAYISARGMYEASINGKRVGDAYLTPGWTSYNNRIQYQAYDIKELLDEGENTIGIILGEGWYKGRISRKVYGSETALLAQLVIEYNDGISVTVKSDGAWKYSTGPVISSSIYDGEIFDSGRAISGWDRPAFDDSSWEQVLVRDYTKTNIIHTYNEPVRKHEELKPQEVIISPEGDTIIDFGQNLVGWVRLKVKGEKGDSIILHHAEVLDRDGNFYTANLRSALQRNIYILNGSEQVFEPHFTWQGFRYVKIEGLGKIPEPDNITAIALYSDMEPTGNFTTSNPDLNQLQSNIQWGQKGNFLDVPTDCPQRDERLGWTGDAQVFCSTAAFNMNVNNFFSKWLKDLAADQFDNGNVPVVIPNVLGSRSAGSAGWSDAATIIPWDIYQSYGDIRVLEEQYPSMKAWVDYLIDTSNDLLRNNGFHYGDWLFYSLDDDNAGRSAVTDKYLIAQCFFANSLRIVAKTASLLGKEDDNKYYSAIYGQVKEIFNNEFVTPNGQLVSNTQTAYVLALQFDLLPESMRKQAVDRLINNIRAYNDHITTGFLGTPYINHVLTRYDQLGVAYELLLQDTYPSWLYPVKKGATTIWERWNGIKPDGSFQYPSMNSFNHYAYGAIGDWMYKMIAGIQPEEAGYREFVINPRPGGGLSNAKGELITYYGPISTDWKIENNHFYIEIEIPVNTSAKVYLPASSTDDITEGGKNITNVETVDIVEVKDDYVMLMLGSGKYNFSVGEYQSK
ncbi:MAG: glycoside hydrolase family 78 protein [Bacteroidota bacterium]|nr:glycoside hydrolase family 78 protein [Bacteroidota bacterium]